MTVTLQCIKIIGYNLMGSQMTSQTRLLIIALTWVTLFILYSINRFLLRNRFLKRTSTVILPTHSFPTKPPGSLLSKAGVLFVFVINILTIILFLFDTQSSSVSKYLAPLKVDLPLWANIAGCVLFVFDNIWGFFTMVYNPNYTPLYTRQPEHFILANQGPYGIMRHPRYASEVLQNIALFLFIDYWLPLLGLIAWAAIYYQARAEEEHLMNLAAEEYGEYRKRTGMFFFIPRRKHSPK
jgi:protein-S-isoprenylcysteine O-methyltransferase Ste14